MTTDDTKPAVEQPVADNDETGKASEENLRAVAMNIDRQMKELAEMNTRMIIAKDQLADLQELIQAKISAFQERRAAGHEGDHTDILQSIRNARDEAAKHIKESRAINDAYDKLLRQLEKSREAALRETRKAEAAFKEKFHEVEEKLLKKAGEIKDNIKNR